MRSRTLIVLFACVLAYPILTGAQVAPSKGGEDVAGPYEPDPNWPQPMSPDLTWGRTGAVFAESPDRVFVMQSGLVPWTWKRLQGPALGGGTLQLLPFLDLQEQSTGLHSANNATHCASTVLREPNCTPGWVPLAEKSGKQIPGARWDHVLMIFDRSGKLVDSWGAVRSAMRALDHPAINHRVEVIEGVLDEECGQIMQDFFRDRRASSGISTQRS